MFHFTRKLTTLIALYSVLGMTMAGAKVKSPYSCPGAGPCPCDELCRLQYRLMQIHNAGNTNLVVTRVQPTHAQMQQAATNIRTWVSTNVANGNIAAEQTEILTLIHNGTWKNTVFNGAQGQKVSASFGGIMTLAQLQAELNKVSPTDRQMLASYLETYGLASAYDDIATMIGEVGAGAPRSHSRAWLNTLQRIQGLYVSLGMEPPVKIPQWYVDSCVALGTTLLIFTGPEDPLGGALVLAGALMALYNDLWGGGNHAYSFNRD